MTYPVYLVIDEEGLPIEVPSAKPGCPCGEVLKPSGLTVFHTAADARKFLLKSGYSEEQVSKLRYLRSIGICDRCGSPLFKSLVPAESGEGYTSQCFYCDEDFYDFEQLTGLDECFSKLPEVGPLT